MPFEIQRRVDWATTGHQNSSRFSQMGGHQVIPSTPFTERGIYTPRSFSEASTSNNPTCSMCAPISPSQDAGTTRSSRVPPAGYRHSSFAILMSIMDGQTSAALWGSHFTQQKFPWDMTWLMHRVSHSSRFDCHPWPERSISGKTYPVATFNGASRPL